MITRCCGWLGTVGSAVLACGFLLSGCGASSAIVVGPARPPTNPASVQVYLRPPQNYEEIAVLEASSRGSFAASSQEKVDAVIERLREEAASVGANGLLLTGTGSEYAGSVSTGAVRAGAYGDTAYGTGVSVAAYNKVGSAIAIWVPEQRDLERKGAGRADAQPQYRIVQELPAQSVLQLALKQSVTSKRGQFEEGEKVPCEVWRDVEVSGVVLIQRGTPGVCHVSNLRRRYIAGFEGSVSVAVTSVTAIDGQQVALTGAQEKDGQGRKTASVLAGVVFVPMLLIPGGTAEIPAGTIIPAATTTAMMIEGVSTRPAVAGVNLKGILGTLTTQFMTDDLLAQSPPEFFRIRLTKGGKWPDSFFIDVVNGEPVEPIPLVVKVETAAAGQTVAVGEVRIASLGRYFRRGINHFEVACLNDGIRTASEVVMDVEF